jgi:hypothetical protein
METEEDIELTEEEISVTRLSLLVFIGLLNDVLLEEDSIESFEEWEATCKEQVGLDSDCDLTELLHSALKKFREEKEYGDQEQEASQD